MHGVLLCRAAAVRIRATGTVTVAERLFKVDSEITE
jgi:hypothetical protein